MGQQTIRYNRAFYDGPKQAGACGETESLKTAPDSVNQAETGSLKCKRRIDLVVMDIVSDILENLVWLRTFCRLCEMGHWGASGSDEGSGNRERWTKRGERPCKGDAGVCLPRESWEGVPIKRQSEEGQHAGFLQACTMGFKLRFTPANACSQTTSNDPMMSMSKLVSTPNHQPLCLSPQSNQSRF